MRSRNRCLRDSSASCRPTAAGAEADDPIFHGALRSRMPTTSRPTLVRGTGREPRSGSLALWRCSLFAPSAFGLGSVPAARLLRRLRRDPERHSEPRLPWWRQSRCPGSALIRSSRRRPARADASPLWPVSTVCLKYKQRPWRAGVRDAGASRCPWRLIVRSAARFRPLCRQRRCKWCWTCTRRRKAHRLRWLWRGWGWPGPTIGGRSSALLPS
jgi:hypothetical protein